MRKHVHPKIENPSSFPLYVFLEYPTSPLNAVVKRGGPFFDGLVEVGFDVCRIPAGGTGNEIPIRKPWTFIYGPVPIVDVTEWIAKTTRELPWCSVIMDVCFPIMEPDLIGGEPEAVEAVLRNRDVVMENIRAACAVTTPHEAWAAALHEVNPRVWWIPDILFDPDTEMFDENLDDSVIDDMEERAETITTFAVKFTEMLQVTHTSCTAKTEAVSKDKDTKG